MILWKVPRCYPILVLDSAETLIYSAIENLPSELNESLTHVRHLDLQAQNIVEPLNSRVRLFFEGCKHGRYSEVERDVEYDKLTDEYEKALCFSKEKKEIVEHVYDTYGKLVRKLDAELEKFRLELEADNSGITEQIEQKIRLLFEKSNTTVTKLEKHRQKFRNYQPFPNKVGPIRRRHLHHSVRNSYGIGSRRNYPVQSCTHSEKVLDPCTTNDALDSDSAIQLGINPPALHGLQHPSSLQPNAQDGLCGVNASDSLCPFGELARRGRSTDVHGTEPLVPDTERDLNKSFHSTPVVSRIGATQTTTYGASASASLSTRVKTEPSAESVIAPLSVSGSPASATDCDGGSFLNSYMRSTKSNAVIGPSVVAGAAGSQTPETGNFGWSTNNSSSISSTRDRRIRNSRRPCRTLSLEVDMEEPLLGTDETALFGDTGSSTGHGSTNDSVIESVPTGFMRGVKLHEVEEEDETEEIEDDEDQKRYCLCRDVSYGDMIACDAPNCPFEWFHYTCVGLTVAPKGQWFCPNCKSGANTKTFKKRTIRR